MPGTAKQGVQARGATWSWTSHPDAHTMSGFNGVSRGKHGKRILTHGLPPTCQHLLNYTNNGSKSIVGRFVSHPSSSGAKAWEKKNSVMPNQRQTCPFTALGENRMWRKARENKEGGRGGRANGVLVEAVLKRKAGDHNSESNGWEGGAENFS